MSVLDLAHHSLLDALEPPERDALVARLRPRRYRRNETVFNDGEPGDCLFFVRSGRLAVQLTTMSGHIITVRVIQPGEFFGELALVHPDRVRIGRASALEATETMVLYRHDFAAVRLRHPGVDRLLVTALADRVIRTTELVVEMLLPPETRVWRRLAVLATAYGPGPIGMTQDDLAHAAGTVRQTANRVLQHGVRQGILVLKRGSIEVLDLAAVEKLANE